MQHVEPKPAVGGEVADIADDEQIAGIRRSKYVYRHATVRTGDEKSVGLLTQSQPNLLNVSTKLSRWALRNSMMPRMSLLILK